MESDLIVAPLVLAALALLAASVFLLQGTGASPLGADVATTSLGTIAAATTGLLVLGVALLFALTYRPS